jgi:hypothetical protein
LAVVAVAVVVVVVEVAIDSVDRLLALVHHRSALTQLIVVATVSFVSAVRR